MSYTTSHSATTCARRRRPSYWPCCLASKKKLETSSTGCVSYPRRSLIDLQILALLDRVSDAVSPSFFLQNIFLVLLSSPSSRLSALNFLAHRMLKPPDPVESGIDAGLVIRGVAATLEDDNVLTRRSGLDLLLRVLSLDGSIIRCVDRLMELTTRDADITSKELLVRAATGVVLQRELSLSRRVYSWLLGPEEAAQGQNTYFTAHGSDLLASTLQVGELRSFCMLT